MKLVWRTGFILKVHQMNWFRFGLIFLLFLGAAFPATFGTVTPVIGGASDLVLDENRNNVYLVNTSQSRIEVYSIQKKALGNPIATDANPLAAAISRSKRFLYVASPTASVLDVIDLDAGTVVSRVVLPAAPEGVAVGADERVLISTVGSGTGNTANVLLIYDPSSQASTALTPVPVVPAPPQAATLPPPSGKQFQDANSRLQASADGSIIVGANLLAGNARIVFVYESSSGTMLRSRRVTTATGVLAVSPDNTKFMSGSTLFDARTLQILAQEDLSNASYAIAAGTQFNTVSNQGGGVFSPDGSILYGAFDISPQTTPASRPNISQLILNDPDNLLINMALQLPENLSGKLAISSDGGTIYALSESGMVTIPIGTMSKSPLAIPASTVLLLNNDQCGVLASQQIGTVNVANAGTGRITLNAQVWQQTATGAAGVGGGGFGGGPGGGIPGGGGIVIIAPGGGAGGIAIGGGAGFTNATGTGPTTTSSTSIVQSAPLVRVQQAGSGGTIDFAYNSVNTKTLGTVSGGHDFLVGAPEAINIPARVRVYQNNRNSEAVGEIIPIPVGISANEALEDIVYDSTRQRLYIANAGLNRVEIFDIGQHKLLTPVKVGQLPRSMAMTPDAGLLYVANSGGESISMIDLSSLQNTGSVKFPPLPLSLSQAISTPSNIAAGLRGPLFMMTTANANGTSSGTIWQIIGGQAVPRPASSVIGSTAGAQKTLTGPLSMTATPEGQYVLLAAADGSVYVYDANVDDFVQSKQYTSFNGSAGLGYYGPVTAGPRGQYYVVNNQILNAALTSVNPPVSGTTARPTAAATPLNATTIVRFTQPIRASATAAVTDAGQVEVIDATSGNSMRAAVPVLEGPLASALTTGRATAIMGRMMAVDSSGSNAYLLTTSGLSIIPLTTASTSARPSVTSKGAVNLASYQTTVAQNGLLAIFGQNMAATDQAGSLPLPKILGGSCVTLSNTAIPLFYSSAGQINAQIPPELASGAYQLVVRSVANKAVSASQSITVAKYAPAVFVDPVSMQAAILHSDGSYVTKNHPASRDENLLLYAAGLGLPTSGKIAGGQASPSSPLAAVTKVEVFFGDPTYSQAGIIVNWAGLVPGLVGVYQMNLTVPGNHIKGDAVPVTVRVNGVSSPSTGPLLPVVAVQ